VSLSGAVATYTPDPDYFGPDAFDFYVVTLPAGTPVFSVPATVTIAVTPVSDTPVAVDDGSVALPFLTVTEDSGVSAPIAVLANDTDVDLDPLAVTLAGSPDGVVVVNPDGTLTFSPALDFNGATMISYTISDGSGGTSGATVYLSVSPVNDAPVAIAQAVSLDEDGSLAITLSGSDLDGNITAADLNYVVTINPLHGTLDVSGRNLVYTPNTHYTGADSITFRVNDGILDSTTAVVSITVNPVNDLPTAIAGTATVNEDGSVNITLTGSDVDAGEVLTFSKVSDPANGTVSVVNGIATYIPNSNFNGSDSFTFKANDGDADSTPATVSITVTPVDDAPVANAQSVSVNEDGSLMITLTGSDVDGDTLFFTIPGKPPHGNVILSGAVATYTPDSNYNGPDSINFFVYTIVSGNPVFSPSAAISITVNPVNDTPVAVNDGSIGSPFVTVAEDSAASAPIAVLANDTDIDLTPLTVTAASSPNGMVTINGGTTLSFTPAENFNGTTTVDYTISDGQGGTASATVFVTVTPVNDLPVAFAQAVSVNEDTPVIITLTGSDIDGDTLTFAAGSAAHGTVILSGSVATYTPASNYSGPDTFTFTVADGAAVSTPATVSVTVIEVGGPAFDEWLTQYSLAADPGTDSDQDSISNAVEYVIGGNPVAQPDINLLPTVELASANLDGNPGDEDYLLFTYRRTDLANDDPLTTIHVEWSTDLAGPWSDTSGMVEQVTDGAGVDSVKVYIPRALAAGGRLFTRLGVEIVTVPGPE
jgi:VCBS repeat-containing protein